MMESAGRSLQYTVLLYFGALCFSYHVLSVCTIKHNTGHLFPLRCIAGPPTCSSEGPCCSLWASSWLWCWTYFRCRGTSPSFPPMSSAASSPRPGGSRPPVAQPQVWKKQSCLVYCHLQERKEGIQKRGSGGSQHVLRRVLHRDPAGLWT